MLKSSKIESSNPKKQVELKNIIKEMDTSQFLDDNKTLQIDEENDGDTNLDIDKGEDEDIDKGEDEDIDKGENKNDDEEDLDDNKDDDELDDELDDEVDDEVDDSDDSDIDLDDDKLKNNVKEEKNSLSKTKIANDSDMVFLDNDYNNDFTSSLETSLLQKISKDFHTDYIIKNHSHYLNNNIEEIRKLSSVIRNKDNIIIDDFHKTIPFLSKYEKTKIIGLRVKQLNNNAKPYISINEESILDNYLIANRELIEKKLPFIIQRPLPNNTFEYWKLIDLDIIS